MTENDFDRKQPFRAPVRGLEHYKALHREITTVQPKTASVPQRKELFDIHLTGYESDGTMAENNETDSQTFIEMALKPKQFGRLLRPAEIQLILAYMNEILAEAQIEEKAIIEEQKNAQKTGEDISCK